MSWSFHTSMHKNVASLHTNADAFVLSLPVFHTCPAGHIAETCRAAVAAAPSASQRPPEPSTKIYKLTKKSFLAATTRCLEYTPSNTPCLMHVLNCSDVLDLFGLYLYLPNNMALDVVLATNDLIACRRLCSASVCFFSFTFRQILKNLVNANVSS